MKSLILTGPVTGNISSGFYYTWKAGRGAGGWVNTNIIGADFKFLF